MSSAIAQPEPNRRTPDLSHSRGRPPQAGTSHATSSSGSSGGDKGSGPRGGLGGGEGERRTLSALMDDVLGNATGVVLREIGPAAHELAAVVAGDESPDPLLAGVYWWAVMQSANFERALKVTGVDAADIRCLLVAHAQNTRFDMLVLADNYQGEPKDLRLDVESSELARVFARATESADGTVADRLRQRYSNLTDTLVRDAIGEVAKVGLFGAVIAAKPDEERTSVPATPGTSAVNPLAVPCNAIPVYRARENKPRATVGVVYSRADGVYASTVLHAVGRSRNVRIANSTGTVTARDRVTDSCLIRINGSVDISSSVGLNGVRRTVLPGIGESASFFRFGVEGPIDTKILAADMSALEPQQAFASKVHTNPDTIPGDSGAALLDRDDRVVCFAVSRSSIQAPITNSTWIWADQVMRAMGMS